MIIRKRKTRNSFPKGLKVGRKQILAGEVVDMNKDMEAQRVKILEGAIKAFNEKGLKFTMDDLAKVLGMSKKTIYKIYDDKEDMFLAMVDYCFDKIKESEQAIINDDSLPTIEKISRILGVLPESYMEIDFRQLFTLKEKYPNTYKHVEERLESGWEGTIALINQGIEEGVVRPINVSLFKTMLEATIEQFFQRDILIANGISYTQALEDVVGIMVKGIAIRK